MFSYEVEDECGHCHVALPSSTTPVRMRVGRVRLLRSLECKGKYFAPFIPTTQLLLLFPACASHAQRDVLASEAAGKMSTYVRHLLDESAVHCRIDDAALCTFTGCAVLLLRCNSVTDALQVLSVWGNVDAQDETMRMCALYIQCYPCHVELPDAAAHADATPCRPPLSESYYYMPTCVVCADRLETVLTGQAADSALCTCAATRQRCTCLQTSPCTVCQMFVRAQDVRAAPQQPVKCQACGQSGDPWVCMICGFVGCSRYQAMHAKEHCICHAHFFSMNLLTQQIWDYHSDAFVHRVLLNVDVGAGHTARVQFPGRDTPLVEDVDDNDGGVDASDMDGAAAAAAADVAATALGAHAHKKCVSAKYDAKLSTSHAQYALLLKNELDAMRAVLSSDAHARATAHGTHPDADTTRSAAMVEAATTTATAACRRKVTRRAATYALPIVSGSSYAAMRGLDDVVRTHTYTQREVTALCCSLRNLRDELQLSTQQGTQLEAEERALQQQLRTVVTRNAADELAVQSSIAELEATLREIELNVQTQRRVMQQVGDGSGDAVARIAIAGTGHPRGSRDGQGRAARGRRGRAAR